MSNNSLYSIVNFQEIRVCMFKVVLNCFWSGIVWLQICPSFVVHRWGAFLQPTLISVTSATKNNTCFGNWMRQLHSRDELLFLFRWRSSVRRKFAPWYQRGTQGVILWQGCRVGWAPANRVKIPNGHAWSCWCQQMRFWAVYQSSLEMWLQWH